MIATAPPPLPLPDRLTGFGFAALALFAAFLAAVATWKAPHAATLPVVLGALGAIAVAAWLAMDDRRTLLLAGLALLVGLILRLATMPLVDGVDFGGDPFAYGTLARSLLAGDGLTTADIQYGEGLRAHFPPLYPVMLAGVWAVFGDTTIATLGFAFACDVAAAWAIHDIARRAGVPAAGRLAAVILLLAPSLIFSAPVPQKESLTILLATLLIRQMLIWRASGGTGPLLRHVLPTGLLWGLVSLVQPSLLLLAPLVGLSFVPVRGLWPVLRFGMLAGLVALLVLAPWWVRNWLLFGQFVPFTTAAGYLVNVQLGPNRLPFPDGLLALPEPERGGVMARAAFAWMADHPVDHARHLLAGIARVFGYDEAAIGVFRTATPPMAPALQAWATASSQWLWAIMLAAAALGVRQQKHIAGLSWLIPLLLCLVAGMIATNIWFEFAERHRYVLTPLIALLAALWATRARQAEQAPPRQPAHP